VRTSSKRTSLVLDAIDLALEQLAKMPDSVEVRAWRVKAVAYEADAKDGCSLRRPLKNAKR
jgi:hypothetical protein